jgi:hypothetical protein
MTISDIARDSASESEYESDININPIRGLNFILNHLDDRWPKTISTHWTANAQVRVNHPEDGTRR